MFAIIEAGGSQFKVEPGSRLVLNKIPGDEGSDVVFDRVIMVGDGDKVMIGDPHVSNVKIVATVIKQDRGKKIIVFKKRPKKGFQRTQGHRQYITELKVKEIQVEK